jgi:phosphotransferase system enzyme I (PtsI)
MAFPSRGIAIGRAYLIAPAALDVAHYLIDTSQIDAEVERFRAAREGVHRELEALRADLTDDTPTEVGAFIDVHAMILSDAMLVQETIDLVRTRRYNVEWALTEQLERSRVTSTTSRTNTCASARPTSSRSSSGC